MELVFFLIGLFCLIIILFCHTATVVIEIEKLLIDTVSKQKKCTIHVDIHVFGKRILHYTIKEKNIESFIQQHKQDFVLNKLKEQISQGSQEKIKKKFQKLHFQFQELNFKLRIGLDDCALTASLVGVTSAILSMMMAYLVNRRICLQNFHYQIFPEFQQKRINLDFHCIICIRLVHIIGIIFLIRKGRKKYERASNRKFDEYSYE